MKAAPVLLLSAAALLAGCTLAPRDTGSSYLFSLQAVQAPHQEVIGTRLIVALPEAAPELDTGRVALLRDAHVQDYYAGIRWASFLPSLVQDDLVKTLETSGLFASVAADTTGLPADRVLKTHIRAFHTEYTKKDGAPLVRIRLAVRLQSRLDRKTLMSFDVDTSRRAAENTATAIHAAFQSAFDAAQRDVVEQLGQHP